MCCKACLQRLESKEHWGKPMPACQRHQRCPGCCWQKRKRRVTSLPHKETSSSFRALAWCSVARFCAAVSLGTGKLRTELPVRSEPSQRGTNSPILSPPPNLAATVSCCGVSACGGLLRVRKQFFLCPRVSMGNLAKIYLDLRQLYSWQLSTWTQVREKARKGVRIQWMLRLLLNLPPSWSQAIFLVIFLVTLRLLLSLTAVHSGMTLSDRREPWGDLEKGAGSSEDGLQP